MGFYKRSENKKQIIKSCLLVAVHTSGFPWLGKEDSSVGNQKVFKAACSCCTQSEFLNTNQCLKFQGSGSGDFRGEWLLALFLVVKQGSHCLCFG